MVNRIPWTLEHLQQYIRKEVLLLLTRSVSSSQHMTYLLRSVSVSKYLFCDISAALTDFIQLPPFFFRGIIAMASNERLLRNDSWKLITRKSLSLAHTFTYTPSFPGTDLVTHQPSHSLQQLTIKTGEGKRETP